jgi:hypothetical protein
MNQLPRDIENVILSYKYQIEHYIKFKRCLDEINCIRYIIKDKNRSVRFITLTNEDRYKYISRFIMDDENFIMELEDISFFENDIHYNIREGLLFVDNYNKMKATVLK